MGQEETSHLIRLLGGKTDFDSVGLAR